MKVRKAIIPAAGLGTRFLPATKAQPKEMLPIVDKPTIQFIVEEAISSGITDIIIVTGRGKRAIEDHFDVSYELEEELAKKGKNEMLTLVRSVSEMANIHYIRQKEPKGLGDAIYCARRFIGNEPFAILLGDDIILSEPPCLEQLMTVYDEYRSSVIGVQDVPWERVSNYGIIAPIKENDCKSTTKVIDTLVEKPSTENAPSNLAIIGRYILSPAIFDILATLAPGKNGEIQLTDAIKILNEQEIVLAHHFTGKRYDIGDKFGFIQATIDFSLDREDLRADVYNYLERVVRETLAKSP